MNSKDFPYRTINLCVECYEYEHGVTLHTFRRRKLLRDYGYEIDNTKLNFKKDKKDKTTNTVEKQRKKRFHREVDIGTIKDYLTEQERKREPISFYYRDDTSPRYFTYYFIDDRYVRVKSSKGYYIKFLIEKIRKL